MNFNPFLCKISTLFSKFYNWNFILILFSNTLSGSIPAELGNLKNLTSLDLGSNTLSGSIPAELGNLKNLTSLSLGSNAFIFQSQVG